jgi:hypothetical protein
VIELVLIRQKNEEKLKSHLQFFFTKGGGVYTMVYSPFDEEEFTYHLISLVNHEILESYDDLPTIQQIKDEIGEFDCFHTDNVTVEESTKE